MSMDRMPHCTFFDCESSCCQKDNGTYWDECEFHHNGGIFSSGQSYEQYQIIEQDFIDFIKVVPLEKEHYFVTSPILRDIIIRCCTQIEIFFKEWSKDECNNKFESERKIKLLAKYHSSKKKAKNWNIGDYYIFMEEFKLYYPIHVMPLNVNIYPFESWNTEKEPPIWWIVYNEIKHSGHNIKKPYTLECALLCLAGLFLMHCVKYSSASYLSKYQTKEIEIKSDSVSIREGYITTPMDSKKYLFRFESRFAKKIELFNEEGINKKNSRI